MSELSFILGNRCKW